MDATFGGAGRWVGMNIRALVGLVVSVSSLVVACSGESGGDALCRRAHACAEKSGAAFSETECKSDMRGALERAETAGCAGEYEEYMDCVGAIDLECSDDLDTLIVAECGAKLEKAAACLGDGGVVAQSACERLFARYRVKVEACGGSFIDHSSDDESEEADDSACEEKVALDNAAAFEQLPCEEVLAIYPAR